MVDFIPREEFVPDSQVAQELGGVTSMTLWRWSRRRDLGFPQLVKIANRNYRRRSDVERFKQRLIEQSREASR